MKKIFFSILLTIFSLLFHAQDFPKILPPSPEASSLAKFTEIPVSHYTGVPNISIPIHTINQKGISIPISLNYHSRGVQVSEIASRVGIGWALSYGGIISRQARGGSDDAGRWGYLKGNYYSRFFNDPTDRIGVASIHTLLTTYRNENIDLDPDMFYFNAGNLSGKFFYNQNDKITPLLKKYDDVIIKTIWDESKIVGFIITDPTGNKFYFGQNKNNSRSSYGKEKINQTITESLCGNLDYGSNTDPVFDTYDSWYLLEIETVYNEKIEFFYERENTRYVRKNYDSFIENNSIKNCTEKNPYSSFSKIISEQYQLKKIIFNEGELHFNAITKREDLTSGHTLDNIILKDKNGKVIKKYDLDYTYSVNTITTDYLKSQVMLDPKSHKRLMLKSIKQKDSYNNSLPPHKFEYNPIPLPNRFSNSQDLWGYYNGANNGSFLTFFSYKDPINREVDTILSEAGMLKKITYPTGGYTKFTYEHNKAIPTAEMDSVMVYNSNPTVEVYKKLSHLEYNKHYNGYYYEKQIEITDKVSDLTSDIWFDDETNCSSAAQRRGCAFNVSLSGGPNNVSFNLLIGEHRIIKSALANGTYTLKVDPIDPNHNPFSPENMDGFGVTLSWYSNPISQDTLFYAAGKRIKNIKHFDKDRNLVTQKEYEYKDPLGLTSGKIFSLPNFYSIQSYIDMSDATPILHPYGSIPGSSMSVSQGNAVGYSHVTEYHGIKNANLGKIAYEYTVHPDYGKFYKWPYFFPSDNEWIRGMNISTKIYKTDGNNTYSLQKEVFNEYLYGGGNDVPFFSSDDITFVFSDLENAPLNINRTKYILPLIKFEPDPLKATYKTYYKLGGTVDLKKSTTKHYYDNGIVHTTTSENFFDYDKHYQLKSTETANSKGEVLTSVTKYAHDVDDLRLISENRIAEPIEMKTFKGDDQISHQKTIYDNNHNTNNQLYLPKTIQTSKGTAPLKDQLVYHKYDDKGNPVEVSKKDGTKIYYVWGYHKTQPIAKIEGYTAAQLSNIQQLITNVVSKSNLDDDNCLDTERCDEKGLRTFLNAIRNNSNMANAQVTTYTYDPLIGVTSMTDPRGETIYYTYDTFNRLEFVKDADGNILTNNQYNYKN